jgi:hypothetical protein
MEMKLTIFSGPGRVDFLRLFQSLSRFLRLCIYSVEGPWCRMFDLQRQNP